MTRSLATYFGMIWKHLIVCEPDHVFIISFFEKDSVLKTCCDLGTRHTQKGSWWRKQWRVLVCWLCLSLFPLASSQKAFTVSFVYVYGVGDVVSGLEVANCVDKWKHHQAKETCPPVHLLPGQPRPSLDPKHSASISPSQHLASWLMLPCTCAERQLGFPGDWWALSGSLSPGPIFVGLPLTPSLAGFLSIWTLLPPSIFHEDFMCLWSPLNNNNNKKKEDKANEFFMCISYDSVSYILELLMAKAGL